MTATRASTWSLLWITLFVSAGSIASATAQLPIVSTPQLNSFALIRRGVPATICVESSASAAINRVASDLAADLAHVAGAPAAAVEDPSQSHGDAVLVGVIGESPAIDRLIRTGRLQAAALAGQWESAVIETVTDPWPGLHHLLIIAGSDRRGAIYGAYWISESLGVSPWSWWADVPIPRRQFAGLLPGRYGLPSPKVKYRGIFLNDEDWTLRPWAAQTYDPKTGNIGPKTYARIFELLLRLRGNLLWPAMHPGTRDFNFYPEDKTLADSYGVIMGSSHAEPMLRDNVDEWKRDGTGEYNYVTNRSGVLKYWKDRIRSNGAFENIYTVGMRGIHDSGMEGGGDLAERAQRLRQIIADQRELLRKYASPEVTKIPQVFCPYKEVLPIYEADPTLVPDDVTLLWPDDNYGYIQHLSTKAEQARSGGTGVYYHISYWGAPYDYLWLPSTPPALIGEEMTKAWEHGSSRMWVVNVGGLKPREWEMEFFLRLAWDPDAWQLSTGQLDYLNEVAARDFGADYAARIAHLLNEYYRLNGERRPEHMGLDASSPLLRRPSFAPKSLESQQRAAAFIALRHEADAIGANIDEAHRPAFFELVAYPVRGAALTNLKWLGLELGQTLGENPEGRRYYSAAAGAQEQIDQLIQTYDHLLDGKWNHMATSHPRDRAVFALPLPPELANVAPSDSELIWARAISPSLAGSAARTDLFAEQDKVISIAAASAVNLRSDAGSPWVVVNGLGYHGSVVASRETPAPPATSAVACEYPLRISTGGHWQIQVRLLPTWPYPAGHASRISLSVDDGNADVLSIPVYQNEKDPRWQEDVLRNASIVTTAINFSKGTHILRIRALEPDILLDSILLLGPGAPAPGYTWPLSSAALY